MMNSLLSTKNRSTFERVVSVKKILLAQLVFVTLFLSSTFSVVGQTVASYGFIVGPKWTATPSNWISGKDGNAYMSNQGIQVTQGVSGAFGNSPISYSNVSEVVVKYTTNTSSGVGTINVFSVAGTSAVAQSGVRIGNSQSVTTTGGTTVRTLTFTPSALISGFIQIYVTCTSNSIYINSVEITYNNVTTPTLTTSPTSLSGLTYTVGSGPSANQSFTLTGTNLNGSAVTASLGGSNYELSTDGTTFSSSLALGTSTAISQTIYARLKAGLAINTYTDVITIAGGGAAANATVNLNGSVTPIATPVITSATTASYVYGNSVSYQIVASGGPTAYNATGLPAGLSVNTSTGLIAGTATADVGTYSSSISASNGGGTDTKTLTWTITAKALTVTGLSGVNKVYDATTSAATTGVATLSGIVNTDDVVLSGTPTSVFSSKTVGTGKSIAITGYTLSGTKAGNYTLTQPTTTGNITQKSLTVSGATAQNKTYDGTTTATVSGSTLVGFVAGDVVTLSENGTFASPNVANGISVTASFTLSGTDAANYSLTQPTGLAANITKATPIFTTSAINLNVGGTYNLPGANITSTSDGTITYTITAGGNATLSGTTITGAVVGTETLTVTQAASANYNAGSTTVAVNVTTITYLNGDYRTTGSGNWIANSSTPAIWERFNAGAWTVSNSPSFNTSNYMYVRNGHTITSGGSFGSTVNITIESGGTFVVATTGTCKDINVKTNGILNVNANLTVNGLFDVEDDAIVQLNFGFGNPSGSIWKGTENFRPESILLITNWDSSTSFYNGDVTANSHNGYSAVFGNVFFDLSSASKITGNWNLLGQTTGTVNLSHNNIEFESDNGFDVRFFASTTYTVNVTIHGDLRLNSGWSSGRKVILGTAGSTTINIDENLVINCPGDFVVRAANSVSSPVQLNVQGDILMNGANTTATTKFNMNQNSYGTANGVKSIVNLKGNLKVNSVSQILNSAPYDDVEFNFTGSSIQLVDVASVVANLNKGIPFRIKNNAYVKLSQNDLKLNNGSSVEVESGGTLDFNWANDGITPLNILNSGSGGSIFSSKTNSILKITSPDGIVKTPTLSGNVRTLTRTYEDLGDFHFIGKVNQNEGNGIPRKIRNLVINNSASNGTITLTNGSKVVHETLTMLRANLNTMNDTIRLGSSTTTIGTLSYTSGFVIGKMLRWFNGNFTTGVDSRDLFPFGVNDSGMKNRFAKIQFTGGSPAGALTGFFVQSPMGMTTIPILVGTPNSASDITFDVTSTEDQGYWDFSVSSGIFSASETYKTTLVGDGFTLITDLSKLVLLKRPNASTDWNIPGVSGLGFNYTDYSYSNLAAVERNNVSSFSHFGFGGGIVNPLPIELTAFSVSCENDAFVNVKWTTASELNNDHFTVEKSYDGKAWINVKEVAGQGNSNQLTQYELTDNNVRSGLVYYRLSQVDVDGKITTFNPISTACDGMEKAILVYPNPVNTALNVVMEQALNGGSVEFTLQTTDGKIVYVSTEKTSTGKTIYPINVSHYNNGMYVLMVKDVDGTVHTHKVIIEH